MQKELESFATSVSLLEKECNQKEEEMKLFSESSKADMNRILELEEKDALNEANMQKLQDDCRASSSDIVALREKCDVLTQTFKKSAEELEESRAGEKKRQTAWNNVPI